jgi:hypothetical protein
MIIDVKQALYRVPNDFEILMRTLAQALIGEDQTNLKQEEK